MSKRILLPYHKANHRSKDYVLYTIKEIEDALKENLVDAIDISRYENKEEIAKILRRMTNDSIKIYTDIQKNEYGMIPDSAPLCNPQVAKFLHIENAAVTIGSSTTESDTTPSEGVVPPTPTVPEDDQSDHL